MKYTGEIESKDYPGFYYVPTLEHTLINTSGQVIDLLKNWCPLPDVNPDGYRCVNSENNRRFIHRLLALTFLPEPAQAVTEIDVNHIDGVKSNNSLDNLEWATRSENAFHAYRTGLRDDNVPVLVKDLRDGTVNRHYSLHECARAFGVDVGVIFNELRPYNFGKVFRKFYVLIRESDQWPATGKDAIGQFRNGTAKVVVATRLEDQSNIVFDSLSEAARTLELPFSTLAMHIYRHKSRPWRGWSFQYLSDMDQQGSSSIYLDDKSSLPETVR